MVMLSGEKSLEKKKNRQKRESTQELSMGL